MYNHCSNFVLRNKTKDGDRNHKSLTPTIKIWINHEPNNHKPNIKRLQKKKKLDYVLYLNRKEKEGNEPTTKDEER